MKICVFGAASDEIARAYIDEVENFGEMLASRGHDLVFGAGQHGLMGAVARGVKSKNGHIHGVIPTFFKEDTIEHIFEECDEITYTETMAQRKSKMEDLADAFVIVPGGIGTFEEFFEVLTLKQLARHTKPIAIYNINNYYDNLETFLTTSYEQGFIRKNCKTLYFSSDNPERILDYIEQDKRVKLDVHSLKNG